MSTGLLLNVKSLSPITVLVLHRRAVNVSWAEECRLTDKRIRLKTDLMLVILSHAARWAVIVVRVFVDGFHRIFRKHRFLFFRFCCLRCLCAFACLLRRLCVLCLALGVGMQGACQ